MYFIHFKDTTSYFGSACGLMERCGTLDHRTVRLSLAANQRVCVFGQGVGYQRTLLSEPYWAFKGNIAISVLILVLL